MEDHGPAQSEPASSQGPQVDVTAEVGNRKDLMEEPVGQPYDLVESGSTAEIHCTVTTRPFFAPFLEPLWCRPFCVLFLVLTPVSAC